MLCLTRIRTKHFEKEYKFHGIIFFLLVLICLLCQMFSQSFAKALDYQGGALCEVDEIEFEVKHKNKALLRVHRVMNIYSQEGQKYCMVSIRENEFMEVTDIYAEVRDSNGIVKKLEKHDIKESSLFPKYAPLQGEKVKFFELSLTEFPFTLEYNYEVRYKSLFFWPNWYPQLSVPVKRSTYVLTIPKDINFKFYKRNLTIEPIERSVKGKTNLLFELTDVLPLNSESQMPPETDYQISVLFTPEEFDVNGYRGSTTSWSTFGKWYYSLSSEQYTLSLVQQRTVHEIAKDCTSVEAKVKVLYEFLQRKTRYVAIELGIGSYRPRDSESVFTTGYGDCKDLSTLLISMLSVIGVKAFPALIRTQDDGLIYPEFPSQQFNHVIVCVPIGRDTLWIDCTCSYCAFGELPTMDQGCEALVVDEDKSAIVLTPISSADENRITKSISARLREDGSLELNGTVLFSGNYASEYRALVNQLLESEKKKFIGKLFSKYSAKYSLLNFDHDNGFDPDTQFVIGFTAEFFNYAMRSKGEFLVNPNLLTRLELETIPVEQERTFPVWNQFAFTHEDEIILDIPENLTIKDIPSNQEIVSAFGYYEAKYELNGSRLSYKRTLRLTQRMIEPKDFNDYKTFLIKVNAADYSFTAFVSK